MKTRKDYLRECEDSHRGNGDHMGADLIKYYIDTGKGNSAAVRNAIAYAKQELEA